MELKLTLRPTSDINEVPAGRMARTWVGETESGVRICIVALAVGVAAPEHQSDPFAAEVLETALKRRLVEWPIHGTPAQMLAEDDDE